MPVQARGGDRLEGLDAWRSLLMIGGILLHATMLKAPLPLFKAIGIVSGSFRMGAFFTISGFLAGLTLAQRPRRDWLRRRVAQLGVPTVFAWGVLCPLTGLALAWLPPAAQARAPLLIDWHHMWFLVALLLYTPIAWNLHRLDREHALAARIDAVARVPARVRWLYLAALPLLSFALMEAVALTIIAAATPAYWQMLSQCKLILGYLPLYLAGFAMARSPAALEAICASWRQAAAILVGMAVVALLCAVWSPVGDARGAQTAALATAVAVASALCPPAAAALLMRSALSMRRAPAILHTLCEASLTIYIVHFPLLALINCGFAWVAWNEYVEYALAVAGSGLLSYGVHRFLVCGFPAIAFLLNGRGAERLWRTEDRSRLAGTEMGAG